MALTYKSYCWALGTTSFRMRNFNEAVERQLMLLDDFWSIPANSQGQWSGNSQLQTAYYDFLLDKGFITGWAGNKPKDAREKTSGLVDFGLIDNERRLTQAGRALLGHARKGDFRVDNDFQIPADSFLYLKQLLKMGVVVDRDFVRPMPVLLLALLKFGYVTKTEFTYLIPLCISKNSNEAIFRRIPALRASRDSIDSVIIDTFMGMDNYAEALNYFLNKPATETVICEIGLNRKSRSYDKKYWPVYLALRKVFLVKDRTAVKELLEAVDGLTVKSLWLNYLFKDRPNPKRAGLSDLKRTDFDAVADEQSLKEIFFRTMHLLKIRQNLRDYSDLNYRYINTANIVLFRDGKLELDIIPASIFKNHMAGLENIAFERTPNLSLDCPMSDIISGFEVRMDKLLEDAGKRLGREITDAAQLGTVLKDERHKRFDVLVKEKFPKEKLPELLDWFRDRNDRAISEYVDCDANIPTIFEYITGIIWYTISGFRGQILEYMRLSLDVNLLPVSHASGGDADIIYPYPATAAYPEHVLLIEATLTEATNQRRAEMEPVSRHLGMFLLNNPGTKSYCVFIASFIDPNVVNDFRMRRDQPFYDPKDSSNFIEGMQIIPLSTDDLKAVLAKGLDYAQLYGIFALLHESKLRAHEWYVAIQKNWAN